MPLPNRPVFPRPLSTRLIGWCCSDARNARNGEGGFGWDCWGGVIGAPFGVRHLLPEDPQIVKARAEALRNDSSRLRGDKSYSLALKKAQQAVSLDPQNVLAWNELGVVYENLGLLLQAREAYLKAIELGGRSPDTAWAYYNMGRLLDEGSTKAEAIAYYRTAISIKPDHASAHNNLGWTLEQLGKYDEAIVCYRQAIKADRNDAQARTNLRSLLAKLGRAE